MCPLVGVDRFVRTVTPVRSVKQPRCAPAGRLCPVIYMMSWSVLTVVKTQSTYQPIPNHLPITHSIRWVLLTDDTKLHTGELASGSPRPFWVENPAQLLQQACTDFRAELADTADTEVTSAQSDNKLPVLHNQPGQPECTISLSQVAGTADSIWQIDLSRLSA